MGYQKKLSTDKRAKRVDDSNVKRHKLGAGPGRKPGNSKPRNQTPLGTLEQYRDEICQMVSINRLPQDKGKALRKWELAQLRAFIILTKDIVRTNGTDPLANL